MIILNVSSVAVLWFGAERIGAGQSQIGDVTAFLVYLAQILLAVMMATLMLMMIPRAAVSAERITDVMSTAPSVAPPAAAVKSVQSRAQVEFRGVKFQYPGAADAVLRDVSFRVAEGQTFAIIGSTGAGKSTLVSLIPRLLDVSAGAVLVDGVDVRALDPDLLWSRIGLVPQRAYLFSGTVASNLRYGNPEATEEQMWQALELAQAKDFVAAMKGGLEASIAQGGTNVSGGQRQRLAIARALVREPEILSLRRVFLGARFRHRVAAARRASPCHSPRGGHHCRAARFDHHGCRSDWSARRGRADSHWPSRGPPARLSYLRGNRCLAAIAAGGSMSAGARDGPLPARLPTAGQSTGRSPPWMGLGRPGEKATTFWPSALRVLARLKPHSFALAVVVATSLVSVALSVTGPMLIGRATDIIFSGVVGEHLAAGESKQQAVAGERAAGRGHLANMLSRMSLVPGVGIDFDALRMTLLETIAVYLASAVFLWVQGYVLNDVVQEVVLKLRTDVEEKIHRLPLRYFDRQTRGELLSRVTNDIGNISQSLQQSVSQLLTSLLTLIGVVTMMFVISPLLALIALVTIPLALFLTRVISKRSQRHFIAQWARTGELNGQIEEAFTGHELVKVFGRHREVSRRFDDKNEQLLEAGFAAQFISGLIMPAVMFIGSVNYVLIAVIGGLRVTTGGMTLGAVQAFIQYSRSFNRPLTQVASMAGTMQSGVASAERVFGLLDEGELRPEPAMAAVAAAVAGRVEFRHVSFRYEPDKPLIDDLSLIAEPGHTVAIVGPTGAGKTTLVNLILRFYELDQGQITLDGVDIATLRRDELRSRIGMVLQDAWLFNGTIRENIRYGRPDATDEEVIEAARATSVDRFVRGLPQGYDTVINEESSNLSAGQKQLITIARAFLTRPALLILDEATSSVDTRTETLVQHAMAALRTNRTSFVIAHRLSTIRDADLILVMRDGRIVEQGTHAGLLAREGAYRALYDAQFGGPVSESDGPRQAVARG